MVQERYVDIGLDHGTSNSAIAVMVHGRPQMIQIGGAPSMPSVVCTTASGQTICGATARRRFIAGALDGGLVVQKYKRAIGDGAIYRAPGGTPELSAVAAGGKVIGTLLQGMTDEFPTVVPRASVISVPAKFKEPQLEGTREAARLAGLQWAPTVQEPVAAGMAFGLQNAEDGRWLIFDLGAGTLDVTLLYRKFGQLEMPEDGHDGDSELGGSNLDLALAEHWLNRHDQKEYPTERLKARLQAAARESADQPLINFLYEIELAKIALSDEAVVERTFARGLKSDNDRIMPDAPRLTREEYEKLLKDFVGRAIAVSRRLLDKHRLRSQDIDGIVYIGGPTKTPYISKRVADELGLRIIGGVDPMTAVAEGAAIYAATLELPEELRTHDYVNGGGASGRLHIKAESSSMTPSYLLTGRLELADGAIAGATVIVERSDGGWRSDPVPVSVDGNFEVTVALIDRGRSTLSQLIVSGRASDGRQLAASETINVWYPPATVENQLAQSLFVGLSNATARKVVAGGSRLPVESETVVEVKTSRALLRGSDERLRIPFYDGINTAFGEEDAHIRSAFPSGMIEIHGRADQMTHDLPKGSEVRLSADVNLSMEKTYIAYVPELSATFEAFGDTAAAEVPDLRKWQGLCDDLRKEVGKWMSRLNPDEEIQAALGRIDDPRVVDELQALIEVTGSDVSAVAKDARRRASQILGERHGTLRTIERRMSRERIRWKLDNLRNAAEGVELSRLEQFIVDLRNQTDDELVELEIRVASLNWDARIKAVVNIFHASIAADAVLEADAAGSHASLLRRISATWEDIKDRYEAIDRREVLRLTDLYETSRNDVPGFSGLISAVKDKFGGGLPGERSVSDVEE